MRFMEECNPCGATGRRGRDGETPSWRVGLALAAASLGIMTGCNSLTISSSSGTPPSTSSNASQLYFAPQMGAQSLSTYTLDPTASTGYPDGTFVRTTYNVSGAIITDSGGINLPGTKPSNGVLSLDTSYIDGSEPISEALTGSWAVELPGQAALVQISTPAVSGIGGVTIDAVNYFTPAVPTQSCPSLKSAETFQFVTIPNGLSTSGAIGPNSWNPQLETAFGSVEIAATGTSVTFTNLSQSTLPAGGKAGKPEFPAPPTATTSCFPTSYGQTMSVPSSVTVSNPGVEQTVGPSATLGIGPSGFLVEDAGSGTANAKTGLTYENFLGAGYGAIGLLRPSSDLTSSLVSAHYQGFLYAPGSFGFSLISSFGYSNLHASCPTLPAPRTSTTLYGGEFANNDASTNAFGNCDLAIDLGKQDDAQNGLYPAATVYVTSSFSQNETKPLQSYSFAAVAIAGQLQGKNAIFLIGADTVGSPNRAWGIYLLQSN
jgi:hypothetical protein